LGENQSDESKEFERIESLINSEDQEQLKKYLKNANIIEKDIIIS